ncbi:MAG TPA: serine hydrolase domain-containing protein [Allosphingosinicella sp.]|jgi:CubicO group peptidase (beta-lactamase class C family)|nr:serine hydrolase domain-containing protein [Allosphingosinicella sp.]
MERVDATEAGFDPERLERIDAFLDEHYFARERLAGGQLLIAREGKVVHFSTAGKARAGGAPMGEDALFRIASMTKPVTSIAFMMLVEEGKVTLDQPVETLIPEWKGMGVYDGGGAGAPFLVRPPERPMMMIDLLRHTSGLTYSFQHRTNIDAAYRERKLEGWHGELDLDAFVAALADIPLEFSPGSAWNYSVSTDVLGLVVERVAGMRLDRFFEERIFAPLGMTDTAFHVPADKADRLGDAWAYREGKGAVLYDAGAKSAWSRPPRLLAGGAGLVSTVSDYHRFCSMLLGGGELDGARIVSRKTIELMTANHLPGGADLTEMSRSLFSEAINAGQGFGLGFGVNLDPAKTMLPGSKGEYYWGGMFSTAFFVDPVERLHMIFMTQLMPSSTYPIRRQLKTLIYSALK